MRRIAVREATFAIALCCVVSAAASPARADDRQGLADTARAAAVALDCSEDLRCRGQDATADAKMLAFYLPAAVVDVPNEAADEWLRDNAGVSQRLAGRIGILAYFVAFDVFRIVHVTTHRNRGETVETDDYGMTADKVADAGPTQFLSSCVVTSWTRVSGSWRIVHRTFLPRDTGETTPCGPPAYRLDGETWRGIVGPSYAPTPVAIPS